MYIVKIPFSNVYRDRFMSTKKFLSNINNDKKFLEILDVKLLSLETIKYSIDDTNKRSFIKLRSSFEKTIQDNFDEIFKIIQN